MNDTSTTPAVVSLPQAKYSGAYVDEIELTILGALATGQHCLLIGAPGRGKTDIPRTILTQLQRLYQVKWKMFTLSPSTAPELLEGGLDIGKALAVPSQFVIDTTGTLKDLSFDAFLADELGRISDAVADSLLHGFERRDVGTGMLCPVIIGTTNFMPESKRAEALCDRIPLWRWVKPGRPNARSVVFSALSSVRQDKVVDGGLPPLSRDRMIEIRSEDPRAHLASQSCVADICEKLAEEAALKAFEVNERRLTQWAIVLWRASAWLWGTFDFTSVHPKACELLNCMWPTLTYEKSVAWQEVAKSVGDPVGTFVAAMLSNAMAQMDGIAKSKKNQFEQQTELMTLVAQYQVELMKYPNDPRAKKAFDEIRTAQAKFVYNQ